MMFCVFIYNVAAAPSDYDVATKHALFERKDNEHHNDSLVTDKEDRINNKHIRSCHVLIAVMRTVSLLLFKIQTGPLL